MNAWTVAALALLGAYLPAGYVCVRGAPMDRLVGFQMGGTLTLVLLLVLAEALARPGFVDLAIVVSVLALPGGLALARVMERWT